MIFARNLQTKLYDKRMHSWSQGEIRCAPSKQYASGRTQLYLYECKLARHTSVKIILRSHKQARIYEHNDPREHQHISSVVITQRTKHVSNPFFWQSPPGHCWHSTIEVSPESERLCFATAGGFVEFTGLAVTKCCQKRFKQHESYFNCYR